MERDTIERLAIDLAAGELNEDAEALFREYLAEHPKANRWAQNMSQIYDKTEAAIEAKISNAYAGVEVAAANKKALSRARLWPVGRWAAVVAFAIGVAFAVGRWSVVTETRKPVAVKTTLHPAVSQNLLDLKAKYEGTFWADKIISSLEPKPYPKHKGNNWTGTFWSSLRPYMKEKHDE
ncbi:MAG TPA: hypothetical protein VMW16_09690 [Sedimentisphaerales bacterium]|nr:hypothetical protein [Sedimentisphaerales bacterium]